MPISTLNSKSLKLGGHLTCVGSDISSTESDVSKRMDCYLLVSICKSDFTENKTGILLSCTRWSTIIELHHQDFNEILRERAKLELDKDAVCCLVKIMEAVAHKTAATSSHWFHLQNHPSKMNKTCWVQLENQGRIHKRLLRMDTPALAD